MPLRVQGPQQRPPRLGHPPRGQLPSEDFPVAIVPDAQCGQHDPCFLVFHRALSPQAIGLISPVGTASFSHNPSTKTMGGGFSSRAVLKACARFCKPQHQPITGMQARAPRPRSGAWLLADRADCALRHNAEVVDPETGPSSVHTARCSATGGDRFHGAAWAHADQRYNPYCVHNSRV